MEATLRTNSKRFSPTNFITNILKIFFRKSLQYIKETTGYEKKILGTTRKVFLFKRLVIKLPRILLKQGIKGFLAYHQEGLKTIHKLGYKKYRAIARRRQEIYKEYLEQLKSIPKYQIDNTYQKFLLDGLMSNWHEFIFCLHNKKALFTTPTHFSFFGLINIQERDKEFQMNSEKFKIKIEKILQIAGVLDDCDYWKDSHTMNNPKNFGQNKHGQLRILDYGNIRIHEFLKQYGKLLQDNFIFPTRRSELHTKLHNLKTKRKP